MTVSLNWYFLTGFFLNPGVQNMSPLGPRIATAFYPYFPSLVTRPRSQVKSIPLPIYQKFLPAGVTSTEGSGTGEFLYNVRTLTHMSFSYLYLILPLGI